MQFISRLHASTSLKDYGKQMKNLNKLKLHEY